MSGAGVAAVLRPICRSRAAQPAQQNASPNRKETGHMLELSMLGPLRVLLGGQPLNLSIRKTQALLLLLALDGPAPRAQVCSMLWPDLPEATARRNLRRELARLRECGASDAVVVDGDLLRPALHLHTDLQRAEQALARGAADEALACWRGPLAEGLVMDDSPAFGPWLAAARQRALRLHQRALEASAAAHESAGDLATALARLRSLLAIDDLNERHHRDAMRLLAATGQRAAALRQFDDFQALLATELGLLPMAQTAALAIALRGDGEVAAAASTTASPKASTPASNAAKNAASTPAIDDTVALGSRKAVRLPPSWPAQLPFVGRSIELLRLQAGWQAGAPLLITGEAGVGKSRLAVDFAAARGPYALVRCRPGDSELALGAFARALRVLAGQPPELRDLPAWVTAELARLLPELGPAPPPLQTQGERLRFDEACIQAWHTLADDSFDAVVLDDWHHADAASRALLARVAARRLGAGGQRGCGARLLLVCRDEDTAAVQALQDTFDAVPVPLAPLPTAAVYDLVQRLSGAADPTLFSERLARATGGNAFFIAETLRDLSESALLAVGDDGRWRTPFDELTQDYAELPMADSVRSAVLARVQRLGPAASRLLEAAALAGEPFGAALLASACALSELDALAALDQAAQAQIVRAHEEGGYGWGHDLARQALESALLPARRRVLQHRLALSAQALGAHPAAALHFEACGEATRAAPHRLAAGDAAHALQALADAARHWRQGLADQPAAAEQVALLARLCDIEWALGHPDEAQACHDRVRALLSDFENPSSTAPTLASALAPALAPALRADALFRMARYLTFSNRAQASLTLLDTLKPPPDDPQRLPWLLVRLGALHQLGRIDEARADGAQALGLTSATGRDRAQLLATLATIEHAGGRPHVGVARANASVALYLQLDDGLGHARALVYRGCFQSEIGEHAAAETDLRDAATLAARFGNVPLQRVALYNLASNFAVQTRPDDALAAAREGWPLAAGPRVDEFTVMYRSLFIESHHARGEWGLVWEHATQALDEVLAIGQPLSMIGVANAALEPLALLGQWPRALALVQALSGGLVDELAGGDEVWLACAQAALLQGDTTASAAWLARLRPLADVEQPRVACRVALLWAEQHLALGDVPGALAAAPGDDAPGMNAELRLRALALRCLAAPSAAVLEKARLALTHPQAHAGAALLLERALASEIGNASLAARVNRLAQGLADWPEVQQSFLDTWAAAAPAVRGSPQGDTNRGVD
jgi:DNA-binding SARP family transcriptional activator